MTYIALGKGPPLYSSMNRLQNVLQYLTHFEEVCPLSAHNASFEEWQQSLLDSLEDVGLEPTAELYTLLHMRRDAHNAAFSQQIPVKESSQSSGSPWEWLLTYPQIPQRTLEWYAEKQSIVTASEIGKLWQGQAAKASLILSKALPVQLPSGPQRNATLRSQTTPFAWGIRYEPVAKLLIEQKTQSKLQDLGRIRHRTMNQIGASPDGLFVSGPYEGRLVEIKCPISRVIKETEIPKEYWQQIQIQLEVCDVELCEYVEVKIRQVEADTEGVKGWITLWLNNETLDTDYEYHSTPQHRDRSSEPAWQPMETYGWIDEIVRQVTVSRDRLWFQSILPELDAFWKTVEAARRGEWQPPPPRRPRKPKTEGAGEESGGRCAILEEVEENSLSAPVPVDAVPQATEPSEMPQPTSYTAPETKENDTLNS